MKKTWLLLSGLLCINLGALNAQAAARMDAVLAVSRIDSSLAAVTVLPAARILDEDCTSDEAFQTAKSRNFLPKNTGADTVLRAGELSFLIMQAFELKGGLLYTLFPGPRYAYREMRSRDFLPGISDPDMRVSGEQLLNILGRVLASPEETQERMAERIRQDLDKTGASGTAVRITKEGIVISLNAIQFPPDSGELVETEKEKIRKIAIVLNEYPNRPLLVGGHTAMAGTPEGRLQISADRAQSVADFLVALGIRGPEEIQTRGYGAERPLAEGDSPEALALNRRVEVTILK